MSWFFNRKFIAHQEAELERAHAELRAARRECRHAQEALGDARAQVAVLSAQLQALKRPPGLAVDMAANEPEWHHRDDWRAMLAGPTGGNLKEIANWNEQAQNRAAVLAKTDRDYACGYARGWSECSNYFFNTLSAKLAPAVEESEEPGRSADRLREQLAP